MNTELRTARGTRDYMPEESRLREHIKKTLVDTFERYGYQPLETPILCSYDILASKYGGGAEILKEMYQLRDQGDRSLALRYDLTVPFARFIGMNPYMSMPFRRYEIGRVFRDGPIKAGRLREFTQCDVDIVGVTSVMAEAELITLAADAFKSLGLDVIIEVNNRKLLSGLLTGVGVPSVAINDVILSLDKLDKIGSDSIWKELKDKGIADSAIKAIADIYNNLCPEIDEFVTEIPKNTLANEGIRELKELWGLLKEGEVLNGIKFNPFLARGLEIYTGTVYEIFLADKSITSSIGSGGRYDKIIGGFLGEGDYPSAGISFGLDVLALAMKDSFVIEKGTEIFLVPLGTEKEAFRIVHQLRKSGLRVEVEITGRRLKKSLDYANKQGIPMVLILGKDEWAKGVITCRNMISGEEKQVEISEVLNNRSRWFSCND